MKKRKKLERAEDRRRLNLAAIIVDLIYASLHYKLLLLQFRLTHIHISGIYGGTVMEMKQRICYLGLCWPLSQRTADLPTTRAGSDEFQVIGNPDFSTTLQALMRLAWN